ncbi:GIY-YIG nuclease family protein [Shinella sp.]|uniref:GIY-YIG nuclease family protein n=1 Tax=Shinella sp. TaxID=1870904 RepID=UPI004035D71B
MNALPVIYAITNSHTGERYIGSTKNLSARKSHHFSNLKRGQHVNRKLQAAFDQYGKDAFSFDILETVENADIRDVEQRYLDTIPAYNISLDAKAPLKGRKGKSHPRFGTRMSEETRRKMSAGIRANPSFGQPISEERRQKHREIRLGTKVLEGDVRCIGTFITPWGRFPTGAAAAEASGGLITQANLRRLCAEPDREINERSFRKSKYLNAHHDRSDIGKTYGELGFGFERKSEN